MIVSNAGQAIVTRNSNSAVVSATTISGMQYDAIDLQYVGNNKFLVSNSAGDLFTNPVVAAAPTASSLSISGSAQVGQTLTGNYTYLDANGDPQGVSTFRWFRGGVVITGATATATTYTLVSADQGNTITFEVTPVSTAAPTTGTPVVSAATATVAPIGGSVAPTASAVSISGQAQVGQTLTGNYTYNGTNPQSVSTFRWLRGGVAITGATATTYTLVTADQGYAITFEVTPVSTVAPTTGAPVVSAATASIAPVSTGTPVAPVASAVSISGVASVGQTLTGNYTYYDANNDPEGVSTFRWLRSGTAIAGATSSTYTLVAADAGAFIMFEVTPVSTAAPTTGSAVMSGATAFVNTLPVANSLSISGIPYVGLTLTGSYTYNGIAEGVSTFRWLRNGTAIAGATAKTYTLVMADVVTTITFEVTPISTLAQTKGLPVVSSPTVMILSFLTGGFVPQGGLTWMPATFQKTWADADSYCTTSAINGSTGWRLPTITELIDFYNVFSSNLGVLAGQGWALHWILSSTPAGISGHNVIDLGNIGNVSAGPDTGYNYISCVR